MHKFKKIAVIVAGGSGLRMGTSVPKQFLLLKGKPLLWHSIKAFIDAYSSIKIILVLPKEYMKKGEEIIKEFNAEIIIAEGGETRFHSVQNGLQYVDDKAIVWVHDGVRCLITADLIKRCYNNAIEKGNAVPAIVATDSIRIIKDEKNKIIDRNNVRIIQTPQAFKAHILLAAFRLPYKENFTDEASVVEASGNEIFLIEGESNNIKVTRPIDLVIAETIMNDRQSVNA
ncbi:MAG: 2-C-methyl-D-erythritol 4-phosphate cytidylyltransferase [Bacteroidetes bacterium]|nr:2-C-methyl-D-erythritol 4-phosphate cytidylyltransferase [Bacteroidota bacterium]MBS1648260.1 2-C-methyl-D-erythritol 4-phosphate cytidylyltransferase [Bacteroidota bacterium]